MRHDPDLCLIRSSRCAGGGDVCAGQWSTNVQRRRRQSCPVVTHFVTQARFDPLLAKGRHRQLEGSVGARRSSSGRFGRVERWHRCCTSLLYATTADSDSAARPLFAECPHAILRLVQPHIPDLSTSNSAPGEDGSKPRSISQRAATRLRHDHHAWITSRSTSVP